MAAKSSSRGSAAASEIRVYIQDDNHDKENIEDQYNIEKISSEESVISQELEETPPKRSVSLNVHRSKGQLLVNKLPPSFVAINSYFYKFVLREAILVFTFLRGKSLELAARVNLLARLPVNYHQLSRTSLAV